MEHRCPDSLSRTHVPHPQAPGCRSPSPQPTSFRRYAPGELFKRYIFPDNFHPPPPPQRLAPTTLITDKQNVARGHGYPRCVPSARFPSSQPARFLAPALLSARAFPLPRRAALQHPGRRSRAFAGTRRPRPPRSPIPPSRTAPPRSVGQQRPGSGWGEASLDSPRRARRAA